MRISRAPHEAGHGWTLLPVLLGKDGRWREDRITPGSQVSCGISCQQGALSQIRWKRRASSKGVYWTPHVCHDTHVHETHTHTHKQLLWPQLYPLSLHIVILWLHGHSAAFFSLTVPGRTPVPQPARLSLGSTLHLRRRPMESSVLSSAGHPCFTVTLSSGNPGFPRHRRMHLLAAPQP